MLSKMEFTVYVLYSDSADKLYIGFTSNLDERMKSHNELGSDWTKSYRPWRIIHTEKYLDKKEAMQREKSLKEGQGRKWIRDNFL